MDPLGMAASFEQRFGWHLPGFLILILVVVAVVLLTGASVREVGAWVSCYRSAAIRSRLRALADSKSLKVLFSFRFLCRVAVVLWVLWISITVWRMSDQMSRYVIPRQLTGAQEEILAGELKKANKSHGVKFLVNQGDQEADHYRADLQRAIEKGGWPVISSEPKADLPDGVSVNWAEPYSEGKTSEELARERVSGGVTLRPDMFLSRALRKARVDVSGGGSMSGADATSLTISIGPRRRDRHSTP